MSGVNGDGVGVRDASYALDLAGFNKIEGFDLFHYGTEE